MSDVTPFGQLVLRYRTERSMSQKRLAALVGRTDGYISQLETGSRGRRLNRDVVIAIAQALQGPTNEFLVAAGLPPIEEQNTRQKFSDLVSSDPLLRVDQKKILVDLYGVFVGRMA